MYLEFYRLHIKWIVSQGPRWISKYHARHISDQRTNFGDRIYRFKKGPNWIDKIHTNWESQCKSQLWSNQIYLTISNHQATQSTKWNSNQISLPYAKVISNCQSKKHDNLTSKWISKRFSRHNSNLTSKWIYNRFSQNHDNLIFQSRA